MITRGALKSLARNPKKPQPLRGNKKTYGQKMISSRKKAVKRGY